VITVSLFLFIWFTLGPGTETNVSKLAVLFLVLKDWNTGTSKFHFVWVAFFFSFFFL